LRIELRDAAVTAGWAVAIDSVILRALYFRPFLMELDFLLLFLASVLVGAVLVDIETVVASFVGAFVLAVAIAYFCLTLPDILGVVGAAGRALSSGAIVMVFKSIFPLPLLVILFGCLLGSIVGERLNLR